MKNLVHDLLNKFDLRLIKLSKKDISFSNELENPLSFLINESESSEFIFNTPISSVRSWGGRKLDVNLNPFINIMLELNNSKTPIYKDSALYKLSDIRKCKNASDTLGVNSNYFSKLAPHLAVFPWDKVNPKLKIYNQTNTLKKELIKYLQPSTSLELLLKPEIRGEAEIKRIQFIYNSILKNGFSNNQHNFEPLEGQLLVTKENKWVVLIRHGEHRIAALKTLGYKSAPILIRKYNIIRESEVNYWWQVLEKRIDSKSAIKLFNNIIRGDQSAPLINIVGYFI